MTTNKNIQSMIENLKEKQIKLNEISFAQFWKKYWALNQEQKTEVEEIYDLLILEQENIDISEYNINSSYNDLKSYIDLKNKSWIMGNKVDLNWKDDNGKDFNSITEWIIPWKTYTIWWYTNTWKSQFLYFILNKIEVEKIFIFSTEVNKWMIFKYLVQSKYWLNNKEAFDMIKENPEDLQKMFDKFYIFDDIREMNAIEKIIQKEKPSVCCIDFVQWLRAWTREWYDKNAYIAQTIQKIWIENNTTMISVAQVNASATRESMKPADWIFTIKWAWEYLESSDVVLHLMRQSRDINTDLILKIEKNKFWPLAMFEIEADFSKVQFNF